MNSKLVAFVPLLLASTACTVGPDYRAPEIDLASSYAQGGTGPVGDIATQKWWVAFNDPILNSLVESGLAQNLDIRTALSRVKEAQAAARATGLPAQLGGSLTASATREGGDDVATTTSEGATFDPAIIIDLFGGERRSRERALAQLEAAELDVGTARLAFVSSLVSSYIDLRYYQAALAISRKTVSTRRETLELVQVLRSAGTATDLDEAQAQAALHETLATQPALESGFYASSYAIATLIAQPVQSIQARLERGAPQPLGIGIGSNVGVPADLLRNRPDIRAAERNYAAAVAAVGVSEADLYPSLRLGGTVSVSDNSTWSIGPALSLPILNRGVLRANRDRAIAQAERAELNWRATALGAIEEVQAAQTGYLRNRRAVDASRRTVASYSRVVDLSKQTFEVGETTLFDLLESQRSLADADQALASANRSLAASWATLQVVSGHGWQM